MNIKCVIYILVVMNDCLYVIGGNYLKGFFYFDVMFVECYDLKGD